MRTFILTSRVEARPRKCDRSLYDPLNDLYEPDTIKVLATGRELLRIRLAWIDAPERGQAFGSRAKQAMNELVFGKDVELRFHTVDRYGRLVCMVFVDDTDASLELIKEGLAWAYAKYLPEASVAIQQNYTAAEAAARAARIGLCADADPQPPWTWRAEQRRYERIRQIF
jgi:endonuclease YncB( thermonuclease family)